MLHASNLPSLNPINIPLIRPPQAAQTRRGRFNRGPARMPIHVDEPINETHETNNINEPNIPIMPIAPPTELPNQDMPNPRFGSPYIPRFIINYRGEAFVYEMLNKEGKFKIVIWNALSDDHNNPCVTTVNGTTYYIKKNDLPYHLLAIDENDKEYYIKVKSTLSKAKDVSIGHCHAKLANKLSNLNEHHVIAVVFDVEENPSVIYYKKMNNLIS